MRILAVLAALLAVSSCLIEGSGGWTVDVHRRITLESVKYVDQPWREVWEAYIGEVLRGVKESGSRVYLEAEYFDPYTGEGEGPQEVVKWYENLRGNLSAQNWDEAFYSSGALSYYTTCLCDPFNTVGRGEYPSELHDLYNADVESHFDEFTLVFIGVSAAASNPLSYAEEIATVTNWDYDALLSSYSDGGWNDEVKSISQRGANRAIQATVSLWNQSLVESGAQPPATTPIQETTTTPTTTLLQTTSTEEPSQQETQATNTTWAVTTTDLAETPTNTTSGVDTALTTTTQLTYPSGEWEVSVQVEYDGLGEVEEVFRGGLFEENLKKYEELGDEGYKNLVETRYSQRGLSVAGISVRILADEGVFKLSFNIPELAVSENGYYYINYNPLMEGVEYYGREGYSFLFVSEDGAKALRVTVPFYAAYVYLLEDEGRIAYYLSPLPGWGIPAIVLGLVLAVVWVLIFRMQRRKVLGHPINHYL